MSGSWFSESAGPCREPNRVSVCRRAAAGVRTRAARRVVLLCAALLLLGGCATNEATGRKQLQLISEQREIAMGEEAASKFLESYGGPVPSEPIRDYVKGIGHELAKVSERPGLPWKFHAIDSSTVNAFALPGGKVFISRGLLKRMDSEAQLAGVLGHEIGHVTAKHINERMSRALGMQVAMTAIGAAANHSDEDWLRVLGVGAQVGGTLYMLSFSRDQEIESDRLGVRYMARRGYDPMGQVAMMRVLKEASGGGPRSPEWLSTHPLPETRIERLERHIRSAYPAAGKTDRYERDEAAYRKNVLAPLKQLPPPAHRPDEKGG